jgi:hypothetical protein
MATTAAWQRSQTKTTGSEARPKSKGDERMNTPADHTTRASHSSSVPPVQETSYLSCPEGRIGYDVAATARW